MEDFSRHNTGAAMRKRPLIPNFEARSVLLIASWTLGAAATTAYAQTSTPAEAAATDRDVAAAFREADRNGDGQLNREEALALPTVWQNFDQIDRNKDNTISLDELAKAAQK
jgi:hypothetical protein